MGCFQLWDDRSSSAQPTGRAVVQEVTRPFLPLVWYRKGARKSFPFQVHNIYTYPCQADKGMYFIWDFTQLNVRPHSRVGLLKYKTAPKCSLSGPFRIGPIPSFRRRPESRRAHSVIPAQAGIQAGPLRHSGAGRNPGAVGPVRSYNLNFTYPCQPLSGGMTGKCQQNLVWCN